MSRVFEALITAAHEKQNSVKPEVSELNAYAERAEHKHGQNSQDQDLHFERARVVALLSAVALITFYLGMFADHAVQERINGATTTYNSKPQNVPATEQPAIPRLQNREMKPVRPEFAGAPGTDKVQQPAKMYSIARPPQSGKPIKIWSVQVSATTSKGIADKLAQQFKREGYAVYVVRAEVKGQTYYRVRVGPFSAREEAEPVRQSLNRHEIYRDAYLTTD